MGSKQPLREMSTSNLSWDKGRPARKADNLIAICESIVQKMWEPMDRHGLSQGCYLFFTREYQNYALLRLTYFNYGLFVVKCVMI
jgi:hypothetical protein